MPNVSKKWKRGAKKFNVPNWQLKLGWRKIQASGIHRARDDRAVQVNIDIQDGFLDFIATGPRYIKWQRDFMGDKSMSTGLSPESLKRFGAQVQDL